MMKYSWKNKIYSFSACILFSISWQLIACVIENNIYLPKINEVLGSLAAIIRSDNFIIIVSSTFFRTCISYGAAMLAAMILGVLCFTYPYFNYVIMPFNSLCKTIPTLVLIVLALIWFDKENAPFIVGFVIVFPILYEGIRECLSEINKNIIEMTKIYEVDIKDKILKIYIPKIKFYLLSIFVSTYSLTFKVVIAGEVHGQPKYGIGSQIQVEKINFNTCNIFGWIVIILIIALILEGINKVFLKKAYRWKDESNIE